MFFRVNAYVRIIRTIEKSRFPLRLGSSAQAAAYRKRWRLRNDKREIQSAVVAFYGLRNISEFNSFVDKWPLFLQMWTRMPFARLIDNALPSVPPSLTSYGFYGHFSSTGSPITPCHSRMKNIYVYRFIARGFLSFSSTSVLFFHPDFHLAPNKFSLIFPGKRILASSIWEKLNETNGKFPCFSYKKKF